MRTDKVLPNKLAVAENVVTIISRNKDVGKIFDHHLTAASFSVRECVHSLAMNMTSTGCLIVDVGSGKGQALSIMNFNKCS